VRVRLSNILGSWRLGPRALKIRHRANSRMHSRSAAGRAGGVHGGSRSKGGDQKGRAAGMGAITYYLRTATCMRAEIVISTSES
jgi:hypothetical protein